MTTTTEAVAVAAVKQDCKTISLLRAPLFVVFKFYSALLTGAQRKKQSQLHAVCVCVLFLAARLQRK